MQAPLGKGSSGQSLWLADSGRRTQKLVAIWMRELAGEMKAGLGRGPAASAGTCGGMAKSG